MNHMGHVIKFLLIFHNNPSKIKNRNSAVNFSAQFPQYFPTFFTFLSPKPVRKFCRKMGSEISALFFYLGTHVHIRRDIDLKFWVIK